MVADGGTAVIRDGSGTTGSIKANATILASTTAGFTAVGTSPGISDDGAVIAFAGDRGNGPGIFISLRNAGGGYDAPIRVAGENGAANAAADLGYDAAGNPIRFGTIDLSSRVGVIRRDFLRILR